MPARFARYEDLPGILELYKYLVPNDFEADALKIEAIWRDIQNNPECYRYVVAEDDGRLVSTANIAIIHNLTRAGRPYAVIENVITHPDARRRGFGKDVFKLLLDFARQKGCYKVMLLSGSHRPGAHAFYKSLGFDGDIKRGFTYDMK